MGGQASQQAAWHELDSRKGVERRPARGRDCVEARVTQIQAAYGGRVLHVPALQPVQRPGGSKQGASLLSYMHSRQTHLSLYGNGVCLHGIQPVKADGTMLDCASSTCSSKSLCKCGSSRQRCTGGAANCRGASPWCQQPAQRALCSRRPAPGLPVPLGCSGDSDS